MGDKRPGKWPRTGVAKEGEKLPSQTFHLVEKSCDWSVTKCKKNAF